MLFRVLKASGKEKDALSASSFYLTPPWPFVIFFPNL
jgi:hypothetical protein